MSTRARGSNQQGSPSVVATPSAAMDLIEAAHSSAGDLQAWSQQLLRSAQRLLVSPFLNLGISRRDEKGYCVLASSARGHAVVPLLQPLLDSLRENRDEAFDALLRFPGFVSTAATVVGKQVPLEQVVEFQRSLGCRDSLGIVALAGDTSLAIGAPSPSTIKLNARDRWLLTQVALHLETGLRLRVLPGPEVARVTPDGTFLSLHEPALASAARAGVTRHVVGVERGRSRRQRSGFEAVDAWTALVAGRWVLVEQEGRGTPRHYALFEAGRGHALRALSQQEARVAELSARGLPGKSIAYAVGVAPATVSKLLASAAIKLGLSNRTRVARVVGALLGVGLEVEKAAPLSPAEREVLDLVRLGWSNARIAVSRERSERTVANQVAALLRKLQAPSRRALAARHSPSAEGNGASLGHG